MPWLINAPNISTSPYLRPGARRSEKEREGARRSEKEREGARRSEKEREGARRSGQVLTGSQCLSIRIPETTSIGRATASNNVDLFFDNLVTVLDRYKFEAKVI